LKGSLYATIDQAQCFSKPWSQQQLLSYSSHLCHLQSHLETALRLPSPIDLLLHDELWLQDARLTSRIKVMSMIQELMQMRMAVWQIPGMTIEAKSKELCKFLGEIEESMEILQSFKFESDRSKSASLTKIPQINELKYPNFKEWKSSIESLQMQIDALINPIITGTKIHLIPPVTLIIMCNLTSFDLGY
jgi:hypothetical protein